MPTISVIIVNYNSGNQLPRCLDSLRDGTWEDYETIVIDNASKDGSAEHLVKYPWVRRVLNSTNRGFAAAQNQGIALTTGPYVLALNFDLVVGTTFLERLIAAMALHPEAGFACGKLLNLTPDGALADTIYAAGHFLPPNRFPVLRGNGELDRCQYDRSEYVSGAPGAAALYRREMVQDLSVEGQFFDEAFFTWYEDVDVDWRAQNRGWKCIYTPLAVAYHQGHIGENYEEPFRSFRAELTMRNRWLMVLANERMNTLHLASLLAYELSLLIYVVRDRLLNAYLRALVSCFRLAPSAIRKRRSPSRG